MASPENNAATTGEDWRLRADFTVADRHRVLGGLLDRLPRGKVIDDVEAGAPEDVVITHDGNTLFAYAADRELLSQARQAIEAAFAKDGVSASFLECRWDEELDDWRQVDPPPTDAAVRAADAQRRDGETVETRTLVASSGKWIRAELEQSMLDWAEKLGIECTIVEHPHLLTTQVGFTVTGPRHKLQQFSEGLGAGERTSIRAENWLNAAGGF
jgi:hypothetical protein